MAVFGFLALFLSVVVGSTRPWLAAVDLPPVVRTKLLERGCFRGEYLGLSLTQCTVEGGKLLAELPTETKLCVVEAHSVSACEAVRDDLTTDSVDVHVLMDDCQRASQLLLAGNAPSRDYPHYCSDCAYPAELVRSVITVSPHPWRAANNNTPSYTMPDKPDPFVQSILAQVNSTRMFETIEYLSSIFTRHSESEGARTAQEWIEEQYRNSGANVTTFPIYSRTGYSDVVVAEYRGTDKPEEIVVIGAHYDSRSVNVSDPTLRAPGADDNGSGTSAVLEFARLIGENKIRFRATLRIISFSGEEQGLVGSRDYANQMALEGANIVAMFNADMLGYTLPGKNITLGMKDRNIDFDLLAQANNITAAYVPELPIMPSNSCCSDYMGFHEAGFSAIGYFENEGQAVNYPSYHTETDLPININQTQLGLHGRAFIAAPLTYAGAYAGSSSSSDDEEVVMGVVIAIGCVVVLGGIIYCVRSRRKDAEALQGVKDYETLQE